MRQHICILICALFSLLAGACASPKMAVGGEVETVPAELLPAPKEVDLTGSNRRHLIGPGDTISVEILGLPDFSRQVQVDANGDVSLPLAGSVSVLGHNAEELARLLETRLRAGFVKDPRVTVGITETVSRVVSVGGEVERPGVYPVIGKTTLMRTIARASGTSDFARTNHVVVFRTVDGKDLAALYDLRAIRLGAYRDPEIYENDVVEVGESNARRLFPQILQGLSILTAPLVTVLDR